MAYIAYPIAKAHPPYGDIYHDHIPVIVTTVAEYAETLRLSRTDFGCASCDDATPLAITLGPTQCGVWLEGEVLLDTPRRSADEMIGAFDGEAPHVDRPGLASGTGGVPHTACATSALSRARAASLLLPTLRCVSQWSDVA